MRPALARARKCTKRAHAGLVPGQADMAVTIVPYAEEHVPAVKGFNHRLLAGGAPPDCVFSESHVSRWLPPGPDAPVCNELHLALEDGAVRGAYALKQQEFAFHGTRRPVTFYHHPISEGIVNRKYAPVGLRMLMHAMRDYPALFALGMAGYDRPLPRMLMALKWEHCLVPFYFRVIHPARFLREMQILRQSSARRLAANLAASSGVGWAGFTIFHAVAGFRGMRTPAEVEVVEKFDQWANAVWEECAPSFAMIAVRDARTLRALYPSSNSSFIRLRVSSGRRTVGWAVVSDMQKTAHNQYGNLRIGTILDGLAQSKDACAVIAAATRVLVEREVDVITSNQSHASWTAGLEACGFIKSSSNFIFAASKELSRLIHPFGEMVRESHLNRGDGDSLLQYTSNPR